MTDPCYISETQSVAANEKCLQYKLFNGYLLRTETNGKFCRM